MDVSGYYPPAFSPLVLESICPLIKQNYLNLVDQTIITLDENEVMCMFLILEMLLG
jgi:hypothetical protein